MQLLALIGALALASACWHVLDRASPRATRILGQASDALVGIWAALMALLFAAGLAYAIGQGVRTLLP